MDLGLMKYLPEAAVAQVYDLLQQHPCDIKVVAGRISKHGDFRKKQGAVPLITINRNLNSYRFLITLIHELAHLLTFERYGRVRPHGIEWKQTFKQLMLPFLRSDVFPKDVLQLLAGHIKNPKATVDSDLALSLALKHYDQLNGKSFIFELPLDTKFLYRNRVFIKGAKRRTRFGCLEENTGKLYLFHHNAEVEKVVK